MAMRGSEGAAEKFLKGKKGKEVDDGMKKIPTLFKRVFDDGAVYMAEEVTPGLEWVLEGEGEATEKVDGSCTAIIDGKFYTFSKISVS